MREITYDEEFWGMEDFVDEKTDKFLKKQEL